MNSVRLILFFLVVLGVPFPAHAGRLDDFYLEKFGFAGPGKGVVHGVSVSPFPEVRDRCRTWLYHDLKRDWELLEPDTRKTLAKVLPARPSLPNSLVSSGGHFTIHYTTSGADAAPSVDWVNQVAAVFEQVYATEVGTMGYKAPPTLNGAPYDIYLQNVGSTLAEFGETVSDVPVSSTSYTSYMIIDNDFSAAEFGDQITPYDPVKALEITAAHEFHHAIQYGYNIFFQSWYAEATSTWIEDEVYDQVNQLYNYLPQYMANTSLSLDAPVSVDTGGGYGRWIWNRHLAERFTPTVVRSVWQQLGTLPAPGNPNDDIPLLPVINTVLQRDGSTVDDEFFLFSKKVYQRNWQSHTNEITLIHPVSPVHSYTNYPVNASTSPAPSITLPHYAFAYYFFQPSPTAPANLTLTVAKSAGVKTDGFKKTTGSVTPEEFPADVNGNVAITGFNAAGVAEGAFLASNSSANDSQSASFTTDGTPPSIPLSAPAAGGGGGGGGGCFIATAAFGSYLHPKVQVLRKFRDDYLMNSPLGRSFVRLYYRISPPVADVIARHDMLRAVCRTLLLPVVFAVEHLWVGRVLIVLLTLGLIGGRCCYVWAGNRRIE